MFFLFDKEYLFFLSFFLVIFLQIININNELYPSLSDCPNEIKNKKDYILILMSDNFIRFSQCFYCIAYQFSLSKRYLCILNETIYEFGDNCNNKYDLSKTLTGNYYNLLIMNKDNNIDYFIYFIDYNKHINLFHYSLIIENNQNEFKKKKKKLII